MKEAWMMNKEELDELKTFAEWKYDYLRLVCRGAKAITFRDGKAVFSKEQTKPDTSYGCGGCGDDGYDYYGDLAEYGIDQHDFH